MRAAQRSLASNREALSSSIGGASGVVSRATDPPSGTTAKPAPTEVYGVPTVLEDTLGIVGLGYLPNLLDVLRDADGAPTWDLVVSCLTPYDGVAPGTRRTLEQWAAMGNAIGLPIVDRSLPSQLTATILLVQALNDRRSSGTRVLVGCGAGCGRSGMVAAALVVASGNKVVDALARVEQRRGETLRSCLRVTEPIIEEPAQRAFVDLFARAWPIATGAPDMTPLFAGLPLGVDRVSPAELHEVRTDLEAHGDYEAAIVALATLGAANASPRHDTALREVAALLRLPSSPSHETAIDFSVGQRPATPEARTKLLAILSETWAEASGFIDRFGRTVVMLGGQPTFEAAMARADEPPTQAAEEDTGPGRATASSDTGSQPVPISPAGAAVQVDIKPDKKFEEFLAAHVADLSDARRKSVSRLARGSHYGEDMLATLFPEDAAAAPDIVATLPDGPTGPVMPATPRYRTEDIEAAEDVVDAFERLHPDSPE